MSTGLDDQLDPATYLPNEGRIDVEPEAYRFARDLLSAAYPSVEFQHFSRSGLAGSALYLASVAVSGRDRVSQAEIANLVGTTRMSIHAHTNRIARLAIKEINFTEHPSVSEDALRFLAEGEPVQRVLHDRTSGAMESSSPP